MAVGLGLYEFESMIKAMFISMAISEFMSIVHVNIPVESYLAVWYLVGRAMGYGL